MTNSLIAGKSVTPIFMFVATCAVPEFPGATNSFLHFGLCAIFQAKVCSLPPEPSIKIFIVTVVSAKIKLMPRIHEFFLFTLQTIYF